MVTDEAAVEGLAAEVDAGAEVAAGEEALNEEGAAVAREELLA